MAPSNTRSERIASRNGVSRRVGLIRLCYRARDSIGEMTYAAGQFRNCPKRPRRRMLPRRGRSSSRPMLEPPRPA